MLQKFLITTLYLVLLGAGILGVRHFTMPANTASSAISLVSLGDSVAAGDGLPIDSLADTTAAACNRSNQAYPNIVADLLHIKLLQFACSSAKVTTGLLQAQTTSGKAIPAQLTAAKQAISGNNVVLTIGANDVDWSDMLLRCAQTACNDPANLADYQAKLNQLKNDFTTALTTIYSYHPHKMVVNDYYSLLGNNDTCFKSYGITTDKIQYVNDREAELNGALVSIAQKNNAQSVRIDFTGHRLCDTSPWIQGVIGMAPLHPTQAGQEQIAEQDLAALR